MEIYPIAAGERGTAWLKLTARGRAGHGSKVNRANAVSRLAAAIARIGEHEWPVRITPTVRASLVELAALHGIDTDPDAEGFDADELLGKLGPAAALIEPVIRSSANPTMLEAGYKVNVIPGSATAYVDGRIVPGGEAEFRTTMDMLTGPDVDWDFHHGEVALQAPVDSPTFRKLRAAVERFAPEGHVVPYSMSGGTDAKQFSRLGITGYGFSPLRMPAGLRLPGAVPRRRRTGTRGRAALRGAGSRPLSAVRIGGVGEMVPTGPYGSWPSPIDAALAASHDGHARVRGRGRRRGVVDRTAPRRGRQARPGAPRRPTARAGPALPAPWNVRSRVMEYGGRPGTAPSAARGGPLVVFAHFPDQRLYAYEPDGTGEPRPAHAAGRRWAADCAGPIPGSIPSGARSGACWRSSPARRPPMCAGWSWPCHWTGRPPRTAAP